MRPSCRCNRRYAPSSSKFLRERIPQGSRRKNRSMDRGQAVLEIEDMHLAQASSCVRDYRKEAGARTDPWTEAKMRFTCAFPALGNRMFDRTDDSDPPTISRVLTNAGFFYTEYEQLRRRRKGLCEGIWQRSSRAIREEGFEERRDGCTRWRKRTLRKFCENFGTGLCSGLTCPSSFRCPIDTKSRYYLPSSIDNNFPL